MHASARSGLPAAFFSLFHSGYYLERNPDVAQAGMVAVDHYIRYGAAEGRDPHPLFNTSYYLEQNPDVAASGMNPLLHYVLHGAAEGRDPHPDFDTSYYVEQNPDLLSAAINPLDHYWRFGAAGGRTALPVSSDCGPKAHGPADNEQPDHEAPSGTASTLDRTAEDNATLGATASTAPAEPRPLGDVWRSGHGVPRTLLVHPLPPEGRQRARAIALLNALRGLGHEVTVAFVGEERAATECDRERWAGSFLSGSASIRRHLESDGGAYDWVILAPSSSAVRWLAEVRAFAINATVAYDAVDLPWPAPGEPGGEGRAAEELIIRNADVVFVVSEQDRRIVEAAIPGARVGMLPLVFEPLMSVRPFATRAGLLLTGNFDQRPAAEGLSWFVRDILPKVRLEVPGVEVTVVGPSLPEAVMDLESRNLRLLSAQYPPQVYFDECRVFVAPFADHASARGDVLASMAFGLPMVTTRGVGRDLGLVSGESAMIADDPDHFAAAAVRLYRDEGLWSELANRGRASVVDQFSHLALRQRMDAVMASVAASAPALARTQSEEGR